jgi:hypothetical protein
MSYLARSFFSLINSFIFVSSLEILADRLNASISFALILRLSSSYRLQVSAPYIRTLLTMLLWIIFFLFFVTSFDHHTTFNSRIIFSACILHILLVSNPFSFGTNRMKESGVRKHISSTPARHSNCFPLTYRQRRHVYQTVYCTSADKQLHMWGCREFSCTLPLSC